MTKLKPVKAEISIGAYGFYRYRLYDENNKMIHESDSIFPSRYRAGDDVRRRWPTCKVVHG